MNWTGLKHAPWLNLGILSNLRILSILILSISLLHLELANRIYGSIWSWFFEDFPKGKFSRSFWSCCVCSRPWIRVTVLLENILKTSAIIRPLQQICHLFAHTCKIIHARIIWCGVSYFNNFSLTISNRNGLRF